MMQGMLGRRLRCKPQLSPARVNCGGDTAQWPRNAYSPPQCRYLFKLLCGTLDQVEWAYGVGESFGAAKSSAAPFQSTVRNLRKGVDAVTAAWDSLPTFLQESACGRSKWQPERIDALELRSEFPRVSVRDVGPGQGTGQKTEERRRDFSWIWSKPDACSTELRRADAINL